MSAKTATTPVASAPSGSRSARIRWSSCWVWTSCGPVLGWTESSAASPAGLSSAGETASTPGSSCSRAVRPGSPAAGTLRRSTATSSGPLAPGPYAASTRSYALRVVLDSAWMPASCGQVRMPSIGAASASITNSETSAAAAGRRPISRAQRSVRVGPAASGAGRSPRRSARRSRRGPASAQSAGTRVSEASITAPTTAKVA